MFHSIPEPVRKEMLRLEQVDAGDRLDGTPQPRRLRQIPQDTGKLLAILAAGAPAGAVLEIGTSAGYSALWILQGCLGEGRTLTTFELLPEKAGLARETFRAAGVEGSVELILGEATRQLGDYREIGFCFLDAEKDIYSSCYELVVPTLVPGGLLIADNVISHQQELRSFLERALSDERIDAVQVPIGKGILICRRI